ncbi:Na(+)-translocating NADH-quinone reductase subunit C [Urechidicola vernalis]|uniref:Na(+)-translocating NADH-quinone reductase subunit C n=1 Tax=Urechidicola vernalis TaxID=3075600 RepID=A0ABU2Y7A8_9FLAO|nr:Na(+)-translocating NADH-quinone reductase subunit C [Urechidicola sp. P050]MDT0554093.1 Na(+)-translocating NADH-quinone reductase subunit C [Urechidicola sp. P050]
MEKRTDKNSYTIVFAIIMVIVVGAILAFLASSLKPNIDENKRLEKQQNILYAMGVNDNDEKSVAMVSTDRVAAEFEKYITKQIVIEGENITEDEAAYMIDLKKETAKAKDASYTRKLPLFIGEKDGKTYYIIPMRGKGLWDAVWGYIALDENLVSQGVFFDHKGETPGLGANINQRFFMDDFTGEHILDESGNFAGIAISKSNADPKNERKTDNTVDAIAGATITGDGLAAMIRKDLRMYMPYLQTIKK